MVTSLSTLCSQLPHPLAERARVVRDGEVPSDGRFVLYWMRTALRASENPALDVALTLGERLERPVFVYHALSERYPYASDRHHTFILEGARDVADGLARRGIAYAFHLERPGHRGTHLLELARQAAAVVSEEMPVAPLVGWTRSLAERSATPLVAVDTACIVPMRLVAKAPERAFAFRRATAALRQERLERPWHDVEPAGDPFLPALPFNPLSLADAELPALVAECEIDHGVAPVPHTVGGSRAADARWRRFLDGPLDRYAARRNEPLADGVSRLSAYLHYGMISPFQVAREVAARGTKGSEKFLDELLVWRELAYAFCFHRPDHASVTALPDWARRTLAEHQADRRPELPSWETLARGQTGDELWNACQRSLLRHGELHNNLRMTWGKRLLSWTPDAATALALLEDLNHRYSLDGRDPASYGGLLWCLGAFDRPFPPPSPILGTVRPRSSASHAKRLDLAELRRRVERPAGVFLGATTPPTVLVVGAGMAGLACARTLADAGLAVTVLDKGRGPGGRVSTRRTGELAFDHGAQYFTVRDRRFGRVVRSWETDGVVRRWQGRIGTLERGAVGEARGEAVRFAGVPGMSALGGHLSTGLTVEQGVRVVRLVADAEGFSAITEDGVDRGRFEAAVIATPAPQAAPLLAAVPALAARVEEVEMAPSIAVLAAFDEPVQLALDGAFVDASPLSWVARDSSKPGRSQNPDRWVLHATAGWSRAHLDLPPEQLAARLLAAFAQATGSKLPTTAHLDVHRWRYALTTRPAGQICLDAPELRLAVCGDWCPGARVEGAFLSGVAAAGRLLGRLEAGPVRGATVATEDRAVPAQGSLW